MSSTFAPVVLTTRVTAERMAESTLRLARQNLAPYFSNKNQWSSGEHYGKSYEGHMNVRLDNPKLYKVVFRQMWAMKNPP